ncbi:MAG: GDP-mannose 4,6-dehydratase [Anaerolineales bacterium]|nr:GDP-mannose 4,6-dehydratase [Anaerolineales bacterium]
MKTAFITGITGQDGSYLTELLLEKGYRVVGMLRPHGVEPLDLIEHLLDKVTLIEGDLQQQTTFMDIMEAYRPDEIYNFAAQSFVPLSWSQPVLTGDVTALGVARLLESIRLINPKARLFQASSSELFGDALEEPQNEKTPLNPRNPYGVSKAFAHWLLQNYRDRYDLFVCSGILYNHESPRRGLNFVTRKITNGVAQIRMGLSQEIRLGNLDARRDWGYAKDYVFAMWLMLQHDTPDDYIIGTGTTHSVREFCQQAFNFVGLNYEDYVVQDERFYRPVEPVQLVSDPTKIKESLGWTPSISFKELVEMMVKEDFTYLGHEIGQ